MALSMVLLEIVVRVSKIVVSEGELMKIDFEAVPLEAPWDIERIIQEDGLIKAARVEEAAGEPED